MAEQMRGAWRERLARGFRRLALRLEGNDPEDWVDVLIAVEDTPGMWVRDSHAEQDIAAYRAMAID